MGIAYPVSNFLLRGALRTLADWDVVGRENVPPRGPLIVVANHQSNSDPPLLGATFKRRLYFLAKDGLFRGPIATWFFRSYGAFPMRRSGLDVEAMRWAMNLLSKDKALVIFPEGTRSLHKMKKGLPGVALLAVKSQAPLLPVGITGTERLGSLLRVAWPTGHLKVNIGQPFSLPVIEGKLERAQLNALTDMIMRRVAMQLPESYRGVYGSVGEDVGSAAPRESNESKAASPATLADD